MAKLITVKNIEEDISSDKATFLKDKENKKQLNSLEVAKIPWRTYLEMQNYNKDKYKMCEICIADQKKKFGGRTPIECTGLRDYKPILEEKYDADIIDSIIGELSDSELMELKSIFSPVDWFRANVHDPETYSERWYQSLTLSCSARNKVLRLGRRCGKTFSIVMDLIYRIATASRPINILVAAPLVTMIHEIEKAFKALSRVLEQENFITKSKATPTLEMTFFNGSVLQGITTSDGGKASRGKKADIIWLDETNYMDRKAIEAIEAIKLDNPNVEMFITSTPKGEGNLYEFAQQENVKEFHYPSYVIPHYNDNVDQDLRGKLSEIGFTQEVLALYGLDQDSVFQQHFIEDSYELYIPEFYNESFVLSNRERFIIIIGVDWNHDNNGTRIIVVSYDKLADRFFCVEKRKIAKVNLTQELSVNMVVELNRKYNADHIVCDEGFGIGQVSELRVRGKEQYGKVPVTHPDIKLVNTESVQFGATLEIRDPTTHETLKKRTKQYIVELAQKLLEEKRLALDPANDSELIIQLKNYAIVKTGLRGNVYKPKDKKIGDHDLDGYMLALYMFDKVYGDYINPKAYEHISMMPNSNPESYDPRRTIQKDVVLFSSGSLNSKRKRFKSRRKW